MVKKFISEGKIEAEQEVQLYIMILEMQVSIGRLKGFNCAGLTRNSCFFFLAEKIRRNFKCHRQ